MIRASSNNQQWYKPIVQGKAYGGPIVNYPCVDELIDMIEGDDKGKYWKVDPIDAFGELAQQIFGSDTGRLVIVSFPHYMSLSYGGHSGLRYELSSTHITAGGSTGRSYTSGNVEINGSRVIKALSLLTMGVRPEATKEFSLEGVLPYLATGK